VSSCFSLSSVVLTGAIGFCKENRTSKNDSGLGNRVKRIAYEQIKVATGRDAEEHGGGQHTGRGLHGGRGRFVPVEQMDRDENPPKRKGRRARRGARRAIVREV
jgi:hypothetical protein